MKKYLFSLAMASLMMTISDAQTNVSGGIYSNTTWTSANSPYVVTDTVVVIPNVTLTVEPGVVVKLADGIQLVIRQATLIAIGTNLDSITFTSNSGSPVPGIYTGIYLNGGSFVSQFSYCNFDYAIIGINAGVSNKATVNNSTFDSNSTGCHASFSN